MTFGLHTIHIYIQMECLYFTSKRFQCTKTHNVAVFIDLIRSIHAYVIQEYTLN